MYPQTPYCIWADRFHQFQSVITQVHPLRQAVSRHHQFTKSIIQRLELGTDMVHNAQHLIQLIFTCPGIGFKPRNKSNKATPSPPSNDAWFPETRGSAQKATSHRNFMRRKIYLYELTIRGHKAKMPLGFEILQLTAAIRRASASEMWGLIHSPANLVPAIFPNFCWSSICLPQLKNCFFPPSSFLSNS